MRNLAEAMRIVDRLKSNNDEREKVLAEISRVLEEEVCKFRDD